MQSDFSTRQKSNIVKALISDKTTAKTIREALNSPIGSTKRKYAQNVVSIMRKLHPDNQMPPMMDMYQETPPETTNTMTAYDTSPAEDAGGMVIFRRIPKPEIHYGKSRGGNATKTMARPGQFDGQGGPGTSDTPGMLSTLPNILAPQSGSINTGMGAPALQPSGGMGAGAINMNLPKPTMSTFANPSGPMSFGSPAPTIDTMGGLPALKPQGGIAQAATPAPTQQNDGINYNLATPQMQPGLFQGTTPLQQVANAAQSGSLGGSGSQYSGGQQQGGTSSAISELNSLMPDVNSAVASNMGPGMFALNSLNSQNGPYGGKSLTDLTDENAKKMDEKYGVTSLRNNLDSLMQQGAGLGGQLNSYIMGRDQFLNDIQTTIENFQNIATTQHSASPDQVAADTKYMNYLYTLKGQQQQRYTDFYNGAINQYNGELQAMTSEYSTALDAYKSDLQTANTITEMQYQMYEQALEGMYNAVQQAPIQAAQLANLKAQTSLAYAQMAADGAKSNSSLDYLTIYPKLKGQIIDSNGYAMPGVDLASKIQTLVAMNPGQDPVALATSAYQAYADGVNQYLNSTAGSDKSGMGTPITSSSKMAIGQQALKNFANLYSLGQASGDSTTQTYAQLALDSIGASLGNIKAGELSSNASGLQSAIQSLSAKKGVFGLFGGPVVNSLADFQNQLTNGGINDPAIGTALYNNYQAYLNNPAAINKPTAAEFVSGYLNDQTSTATRNQPVSPQDLALHVGEVYGRYLIQNAFNSATSDGAFSSVSPEEFTTGLQAANDQAAFSAANPSIDSSWSNGILGGLQG